MLKKMYNLQKKKGKKGFSMIELIIVIAIMAILVALIGSQLIPYMEKSREKKDLSALDSCLTNFQAAIAEKEINLSVTADQKVTGYDTDYSADISTTYYKLAPGNDTGTTDIFKSKKATDSGKTAADVTFEVKADNEIVASIGKLHVSSINGSTIDD